MSPVSDFPVKLCDACLSPLQTSFDIVNGCTYRQKRRDIERSGRLGCIFCAAIDAAGQRELFESKGLSEPESCWPYRGWGWYADLESEVVLRADMRSGNFELYVLLPKPSDLGSPKLWKSVSSWFVFANPGKCHRGWHLTDYAKD
jgi:hypothetical protein